MRWKKAENDRNPNSRIRTPSSYFIYATNGSSAVTMCGGLFKRLFKPALWEFDFFPHQGRTEKHEIDKSRVRDLRVRNRCGHRRARPAAARADDRSPRRHDRGCAR